MTTGNVDAVRIECGGVPWYWVEAPAPYRVRLQFRVGRADEPLPAAGLRDSGQPELRPWRLPAHLPRLARSRQPLVPHGSAPVDRALASSRDHRAGPVPTVGRSAGVRHGLGHRERVPVPPAPHAGETRITVWRPAQPTARWSVPDASRLGRVRPGRTLARGGVPDLAFQAQSVPPASLHPAANEILA